MKIKFADILETLAKLTAPPPPRRITKTNLAAMSRGRARAARARGLAARAKVEERLKNERAATGRRLTPPPGERMHQVILRAMEPGGWYARFDVVNLTGFDRDPTSAKLKYMRGRGWLRREQNPAWDQKHHPSPDALQAGAEVKEPQWLYTLTGEGERQRAELALGGDVHSPELEQVADGGTAADVPADP